MNRKEITAFFIAVLVLGFSINLIQTWSGFLYALVAVFIILLLNIITKKIVAFYFDSDIEIKLWEIERYGVKKHKHFKRAFPAGAFFPILSKLIFFPINSFVWMASLVFDVKPKIYRAAKRHGFYNFSEMSEFHIGLIAASGIIMNLGLAILGYLLGFPLFAKLNIYYSFFNLLPISNLDGNKIFFGNFILWCFLAIISLIGLGYALLLI